GMATLAAAIGQVFPASARLACDELTHAMLRSFSDQKFTSAAGVLGAAKICKTPDELACIRTAQHINELAMWDVQRALRPGLRQTDLSGIFLRRAFELGATANVVDPIWQIMPAVRAAGPWTTHGDIAFPTPSTPRFVRDGDVIWVDSGLTYQGYASDF